MADARRSVFVLGAGGHGKVVISTLRASGYRVEAVFDDNPTRWGNTLLGVAIRGSIAEAADLGARLSIAAIGDNAVRKRLVDNTPRLEWATAVHPSCSVHESARLGPGTVVFAGAVIQPEAIVGAHTIINTGATVDHDCLIGDFAHLAPGVHLAGSVYIGEGTALGVGSAVAPNRRIGAWTMVGAGAVVASDLPGGVTAVGVPARPIAPLGS